MTPPFHPNSAQPRDNEGRRSFLCRFRHSWIADAEIHPISWLHSGEVRRAKIRYRRCHRCASWQRQDFWTGRYEDVDGPYDVEPNPGIAPGLD